MTKYYYIVHFSDGDYNSYEEYGDDDYEGTFSSYDEAAEAALYCISCFEQGQEILHLSNPGDYDEPNYDEQIDYDIEELEVAEQ